MNININNSNNNMNRNRNSNDKNYYSANTILRNNLSLPRMNLN